VGLNPTFNIGPIAVGDITIHTPGLTITYSTSPTTSVSGGSSNFVVVASYALGIPGAITINGGPAGVPGSSPGFKLNPINLIGETATLPGFTIPTSPIGLGLPLSLSVPGFDLPAGGIPALPLGLGLSDGTPAFSLPTAVIDRIALELHVHSTLGVVQIPLAGFGGTPGFWNSTTVPSSGFYNVGGGGGSGFWNSGAGMSGWVNAIADQSLGSASGFFNFGSALSGLLNQGAGLSGVFNTGTLGQFTQAFTSGFLNTGQRLSGMIYTGIGP
jgi:hypothetical protein